MPARSLLASGLDFNLGSSLLAIKVTHRAKTHSNDFNVCYRNVWTLSCPSRRNPKATLLALATAGHKPTGKHVDIFIRWV